METLFDNENSDSSAGNLSTPAPLKGAGANPGSASAQAKGSGSATPPPPSTTFSRPAFLLPSDDPKEIGQLGGYGILRILGKGGMGMVLLAHDKMLDRQVAVKVMLPEVATPDNRDRFFREARSTAALNHDHIVPIFQVGEENSVPYLVMPYLQGEALDRRLTRERKPPLRETLRIIREAATGLVAAHAKGMIHRDIKPGNIWLEAPQGRVRILDFGLAKTRATDVNITQAGAIIGTPAYMAPEQAAGREIDTRADLFSLGVIFYEMLSGVRPFQGSDTMAILTSLLTVSPVTPAVLDPTIPKDVSRLVMAMIAKDPKKRPKSARDVAGFLAQLEKITPKSAGPGSSPIPEKTPGQPPDQGSVASSPSTPAADDRIFDTKMILEAIPAELLALTPGGSGSASPVEPPVLSLELLAGGSPPNQVRGDKIQIGRASGSKLRIQSSQVSRTHAQIVWVPTNQAHYTIEDLGSTNGTFINGSQIKLATPLLPGDQLNFGTLGFRIDYPMASEILKAISLDRSKQGFPAPSTTLGKDPAQESPTLGIRVENQSNPSSAQLSQPTRLPPRGPNKGL